MSSEVPRTSALCHKWYSGYILLLVQRSNDATLPIEVEVKEFESKTVSDADVNTNSQLEM